MPTPSWSSIRSRVESEIPKEFLVEKPGPGSKTSVSWSHVKDPISLGNDGLQGQSRRWGDASLEVQKSVLLSILKEAEAQDFSLEEAALAVAVARVESGFNPDAAAHSTSASGVGQFINKTGKSYGIEADDRFDTNKNVSALVSYLGDKLEQADSLIDKGKEEGERSELAYALYHDGPSLSYGGLEIAQEKVIPFKDKFLGWIFGDGDAAQ